MAHFDLHRLPTSEDVAKAAATLWTGRLAKHKSDLPYSVALSGGRIAKTLFKIAAEMNRRLSGPLELAQFFWADERCVPPDHPDSNFLLAWELLLSQINIPASQIHRIEGEKHPAEAASNASLELDKNVSAQKHGFPVLDLIFLGMGEDGHVASLFPGSVVDDMAASYTSVRAPKPPPDRVTLTHPVLCVAREVVVLVTGPAKVEALRRSLAGDETLPLGKLLVERKQTVIMTDLITG